MKKLLVLFKVTVVCVCVVFGSMMLPVKSYAQSTTKVESRMAYISSYTTDLTISSSGVATITGLVRGKSNATSTYVKCTLQMSVSGGWVDVKSWEASGNGTGATIGTTYQLSSRGTYRVYMTCRANTEEKTMTSSYRTY